MPNLNIFWFNGKDRLRKFPPQFFQTNSFDFRKCQLSDFLTTLDFLYNYPVKSDTINVIDTTECLKRTLITCYVQFTSSNLI